MVATISINKIKHIANNVRISTLLELTIYESANNIIKHATKNIVYDNPT